MVLLASLPSELLSLICSFVDPEDFASFSVLNSRFRAIANPFRIHHHNQWSKYSVLQDRTNTDPWFWHNVLRSVLDGWAGARYVRVVKVSYLEDVPDSRGARSYAASQFRHNWDFEEHKEVLQRHEISPEHGLQRRGYGSSFPHEHRRLFVKALREVPWLVDQGSDQAVADLHKADVVLALLASYLPNLQTLAIARHSSSNLCHLQTAVSHAARSPSRSGSHSGSLGRLREIDFTTAKYWVSGHLNYINGPPGIIEPSFLLPFLALPSIQTLKVAQLEGHLPTQVKKLDPSELVALSLSKVLVSPTTLTSILERTTKLRSCEVVVRNVVLSAFDVIGTVDALRTNTSGTLETLTIDAFPLKQTTIRSLSFANFNVLTYLDIMYYCFLIPIWSVMNKPILPDLLPAALEVFKTQTNQFCESLAPNILALLSHRPYKQANLKCLSIKSWIGDEHKIAMQQACHKRNIRCEDDLATQVVGPLVGVSPLIPIIHEGDPSGPRRSAIDPGLSLHAVAGPGQTE